MTIPDGWVRCVWLGLQNPKHAFVQSPCACTAAAAGEAVHSAVPWSDCLQRSQTHCACGVDDIPSNDLKKIKTDCHYKIKKHGIYLSYIGSYYCHCLSTLSTSSLLTCLSLVTIYIGPCKVSFPNLINGCGCQVILRPLLFGEYS